VRNRGRRTEKDNREKRDEALSLFEMSGLVEWLRVCGMHGGMAAACVPWFSRARGGESGSQRGCLGERVRGRGSGGFNEKECTASCP